MANPEPVTPKTNVLIAKEPHPDLARKDMEFAASSPSAVPRSKTKIALISNPPVCPKVLVTPKSALAPPTFAN